MSTKLLFLALDVDDTAFHGCAFNKDSGEYIEFACKPNLASLKKHLNKLKDQGFELKICYESCHFGFSLYRDLTEAGWSCAIISPSSIPRQAGKVVKTDRIDARKLSQFYANGLLTTITIPEKSQESFRNYLRSRRFLVDQRANLKNHIVSICRLEGINYRLETGVRNSNYFTVKHLEWLNSKAHHSNCLIFKENLKTLLAYLSQLNGNIDYYEEKIEALIESSVDLKERVDSLQCYRGISLLTAVTIVAEIGNIKRFDHPRKLVSYIGLDLREYSSGGKERKFGISKLGNKYVRTALVESSHSMRTPPRIGVKLKRRRTSIDPEYIAIADRCMKRVAKKSFRLIEKSKHMNKVKITAVRESLGFIWESLNLAEERIASKNNI